MMEGRVKAMMGVQAFGRGIKMLSGEKCLLR